MRRVVLVSAFVVFLLGVPMLLIVGRPAYRHHKEVRAVERAKVCMAGRDYAQASVSARSALLLNPTNLEAVQIMCEVAETIGAPQALDWRRRVAEISPTLDNKLRLASSALRLQSAPFPLAAEQLREVAGEASGSARFHAVSAEMCLRLGDFTGAEQHFEAAAGIEPTNELHRLNLAVIRLNSTDPVRGATGRLVLESLQDRPTVGPVALRWLVADAMNRKDFISALSLSGRLLQTDASTMDDRLQHLSVLHEGRQEEFTAVLAAMQHGSSTNAAELYLMAEWMLKQGFCDEALVYLRSCPKEVLATQPAPMALVDCLTGKMAWGELEGFLGGEKWGELDFLRLGFLSRALREQRQELASEARWRAAVLEAGDRLGSLAALLEMARGWGRQQDAEALLWKIGQRFPREKWAFRELDRLYLSAGNTRGLNRLYASLAGAEGTNYVARNNLAATSLLLRQNLASAQKMAREVYLEHPENASIAATYAFSLHLDGKTQEGVAVLEKGAKGSLENPSVALYYAVLLAAAGDAGKAAEYAAKAKGATMLPEERALLKEMGLD